MTNLKFPRRQFLQLVAGAVALPAVSRIARAQSYPNRPICLIVGYAAGGPTDITARLIGQHFSPPLAHPVVIDNRPGPSSKIATQGFIISPADGYTLILLGVWETQTQLHG